MSSKYFKVVFLCYWSLLCTSTYSAHGVTFSIQGIGLAKLLEANPDNLSETVQINEKANYIHEMLHSYPWTECSLEATIVDILDMDQAYSDTDDSISSKAEANKQKRLYQRTRNLKANNRKGGIQFEYLKETYIKLGDIDLKNDDST